jgi:outer membrane protein assembly factor BamB
MMLKPRRLLLVGLAILAIGFSGCDWTMVGFNAANTLSTPDTSLNSSNVPDLVLAFSANTGGDVFGSPIVASGVLYVDSINTSSSTVSLEAFDAAGNTNCSGATCQPLWTAPLGSGTVGASTGGSSPAVVDGVVYAGASNNLEAFDAAGVTNCSGTPKVCAPLWSASGGPVGTSSPVVANGVVYIGSTDGNLYAFDAAGVTNCSGTPKTCGPLWSGNTGGAIDGAPAVANGVAYVGSTDDDLYAFDAAGVTNCSGVPTTCSPLWSAATAGPIEVSPAVANGVIYVGTDQGVYSGDNLYAFDAAGVTNCSGTPKTCNPLWLYEVTSVAVGAPVVADGYVYEGEAFHIQGGALAAFDASGNTNCSGTPKVCAPLWTGTEDVGATVANGLVYESPPTGPIPGAAIKEYDETGQLVASGQPADSLGAPIVANGTVYVGTPEGVSAYAPLHTQVLVPSNGSSVSGTTVLDASATPGVTLLPPAPAGSGVQFVLSGGSLSEQVVGTATPTLYGWIAEWDTTTVPNGTYTLQSVATATTTFLTSVTVTSPGITVTVNNGTS